MLVNHRLVKRWLWVDQHWGWTAGNPSSFTLAVSHVIWLVHLCYTDLQLVSVMEVFFTLTGLRSSIYGQILSLKNHIQCPFPCKSAWGLVLCHPSIYLIPTTCCSLCTMKRFQPFFFTCSPSALSAGGCLSPARLHLPEGCLPSSPSHIYC